MVSPLNRQQPIGNRGFTLFELVIVLAILGLLMMMAAPSFNEVIANQRGKSGAQDLMASLIYARSEAIKRNSDVYVIAKISEGKPYWHEGWFITTANTDTYEDCTASTAPTSCLRVEAPLPRITVRINDEGLDSIKYKRDGRFEAATATPEFQFCTPNASKRVITLNLIGTPRTTVGAPCVY